MTKATPSLYLLAFVLLTRLAYADQEIERGQIQTNNFIVDVSDRKLGQEVAELAEKYRFRIAKRWLGRELPQWKTPCLLFIFVGDKEEPWAWTYHFHGNIRGITIRGNYKDI